MIWSSSAEFFAMGGYGAYVWGSMGMTALAIGVECLLLRKRRATALSQRQRESRLPKEAAIQRERGLPEERTA